MTTIAPLWNADTERHGRFSAAEREHLDQTLINIWSRLERGDILPDVVYPRVEHGNIAVYESEFRRDSNEPDMPYEIHTDNILEPMVVMSRRPDNQTKTKTCIS